MSTNHHDEYLESKVLTAPAQKLHLMLIEGAIRFGRQAQQHLEQGDNAAAGELLLRVMDIVGEMLAGVRQGSSPISAKLAELYLFVFRRVGEAKLNDSAEQLADALRVLDYERETWQIFCDQQEEREAGESAGPKKGRADQHVPPPLGANVSPTASDISSFSLDA